MWEAANYHTATSAMDSYPQDNAAVFEFINTFGHVAIYFGASRHIHPVEEVLHDGRLFPDYLIQDRNIILCRKTTP